MSTEYVLRTSRCAVLYTNQFSTWTLATAHAFEVYSAESDQLAFLKLCDPRDHSTKQTRLITKCTFTPHHNVPEINTERSQSQVFLFPNIGWVTLKMIYSY